MIDDDPAIAETVRRTMVSQGWTAAVAADGITGLDAASGDDFDVIVLDIMMPGRSGYEVVRDLRRSGVWTPVLMLASAQSASSLGSSSRG
ncbi:response regulator [Gordonia sp. MP11Mi]|uniref:response regulator n=1 Tax=Gordonia sp. MP11Mi TaxID=3022769 RepID=UPI003B227F0A